MPIIITRTYVYVRTVVGAVVDEDDLSQQVRGNRVDDAVHGAQQCRQRLVVEYDNDGRVGKIR